MKRIKVLNNQSLFDIAIQEYGTVEAVFDLAMANGLGITDELNAGQELVVPVSDFVVPEIVNYYKKNGLHPVSGNINYEITDFTANRYDDMKILFEWGDSDSDHPGMTNKIIYEGKKVKKHLLRIRLSEDNFLKKVQEPILLIDRRRRKGNRTSGKTRLAGWKHPHPDDWNKRLFEIPLTTNPQVLDFGQEWFFRFDGDYPRPRGAADNVTENGYVAFVDLAFRIRYKLYGNERTTPHLGHIRMTMIYDQGEKDYIISYAYK